jgi:TBP-interacting protein
VGILSEIREISGPTPKRLERVGAHSHIRGLGVDENLRAKLVADGMVGQTRAREAAYLVVKMAKEGKLSGKGVLVAGPPGTGKTALAVGIARELGEDVPFIVLSGSEIYSAERRKTDVLMEAMRKAIGVRLHEMRKIYEGEVTKLDVRYASNPYNPYYQIPRSARITLETKKQSRTFEVGEGVAAQLVELGVREGDVIQIDAETGRVARVGRSSSSKELYEIETEKTVPKPDGDVMKEKEFIYTMTLYDLDELFARRRGSGIASLLFGFSAEKEISSEIRASVDEQVSEWVKEGRAEIIPGVLFIDDVHMMDIEALSFLARAMEGELIPIIVMATNRGITTIRGTDVKSPFGLPLDLLDRLVIITTDKYNEEEIREILKIRAAEEKIELEREAFDSLVKIGAETSLRHAVQLLSMAGVRARSMSRDKVLPEDVEEVKKLYTDVKQAMEHLRKYESELLS